MCAFAIREAQIERVVYGLTSPVMGGATKWDILSDDGLSSVIPEIFGRRPPHVVGGVLALETAEVWRSSHPLAWKAITRRGCFTCENPTLATAPRQDEARRDEARIGVLQEVWSYLRPRRTRIIAERV